MFGQSSMVTKSDYLLLSLVSLKSGKYNTYWNILDSWPQMCLLSIAMVSERKTYGGCWTRRRSWSDCSEAFRNGKHAVVESAEKVVSDSKLDLHFNESLLQRTHEPIYTCLCSTNKTAKLFHWQAGEHSAWGEIVFVRYNKVFSLLLSKLVLKNQGRYAHMIRLYGVKEVFYSRQTWLLLVLWLPRYDWRLNVFRQGGGGLGLSSFRFKEALEVSLPSPAMGPPCKNINI